MEYKHKRHETIAKALANFNADFLEKNNVLFGGGTRIAMELGEYRESVDIDFLCPDIQSYREVRKQVTSNALGDITRKPFDLAREVRFDRYGVRTVINVDDTPIKLELVSFADYRLKKDDTTPFPVPSIDRESCYVTKLLAHADRSAMPDKKDFIDLMMMYSHWGAPSQNAWAEVERHYGQAPKKTLEKALNSFIDNPEKIYAAAAKLHMDSPALKDQLLESAQVWQSRFEISQSGLNTGQNFDMR